MKLAAPASCKGRIAVLHDGVSQHVVDVPEWEELNGATILLVGYWEDRTNYRWYLVRRSNLQFAGAP